MTFTLLEVFVSGLAVGLSLELSSRSELRVADRCPMGIARDRIDGRKKCCTTTHAPPGKPHDSKVPSGSKWCRMSSIYIIESLTCIVKVQLVSNS